MRSGSWTTDRARRTAGLLLAAWCTGCGSRVAAPRAAPQPLPRVAGEYRTAVTLLESTCTGTTVQTFPTGLAQAPGSAAITVTHAGSSYAGTLQPDGTFATAPLTQDFGGTSYTITVVGRITSEGMDAIATVQAHRTPPCRFRARWAGPRTAAP